MSAETQDDEVVPSGGAGSGGEEVIGEGILPKVQALIAACRSHAADLLRAASTLLDKECLPNIAYHLAALALEETGKAELLVMRCIARARRHPDAWLTRHAEDHLKKLFWALWGPSFGREVITKQQIETFQGLAKEIHETRLRGLYVTTDIDSVALPKDHVEEAEARRLVSLATSRLELDKCYELKALSEEEQDNLSWFLTVTDESDKRRLILGPPSMEKLAELGSPRKWMAWLREQFEEAEAEGRAHLERELRRAQPSCEEARSVKWKLKVRFYTNSHSIRPKPLNWWNKGVGWIKLRPVGKRKNELIVEFRLPKSVPLQALWWTGWGAVRRFIVALNVGSMGYFWWYVPRQISRFYETLTDTETNTDVVVERSPILALDWQRGVLSEQELRHTALCLGLLPGPQDSETHEPFDHYLTGLALLGKNDIHLQLEANAYEQFYRSLKSGMKLYQDWDGVGPFGPAFDAVIQTVLPDFEDTTKYLELCRQFELGRPKPTKITLTEVGVMKLLCDAYFLRTFDRLAVERRKMENDSARQVAADKGAEEPAEEEGL